MGRHLRSLGNNGGIHVHHRKTFLQYPGHHPPKQIPAIGTGPFVTGIREQMPDIPQRDRAKQRIRQRMQQHIAIRMGFQTVTVGNLNTTENDSITLTKGMDIKALTNAHDRLRKNRNKREAGKPYSRPRINSARARSDGTVIFRLSGRPSTRTGILPENSMAEDSSVTG